MIQVTISGEKKQLAEDEPVLKAFHIENGEVRKEILEIVEGE